MNTPAPLNYTNAMADPDSFFDSAAEALSSIEDQADLAYRYRCSLVQTATENGSPSVNLNAPIVFERHHAFNWLIRYSDRDWDEAVADEA